MDLLIFTRPVTGETSNIELYGPLKPFNFFRNISPYNFNNIENILNSLLIPVITGYLEDAIIYTVKSKDKGEIRWSCPWPGTIDARLNFYDCSDPPSTDSRFQWEDCLPNVTSFLDSSRRCLIRRGPGNQFLRSGASENSKFLDRSLSCHSIRLFAWSKAYLPAIWMRRICLCVIETLNRFFDTLEITEKQFVCKEKENDSS